MIEWFLSLDKAAQAALASGLASSFVIAIVAGLGFWLTFKTSTAANREIAKITESSKLEEIRHLTAVKLADYRIDWMEALRRDCASLYKTQYEISMLKKSKVKERATNHREQLQKLYLESAELKARILMRLKQQSDDENEVKLETLLRRSVSSDSDKAQDQRREIRELTRSILHTEWKKIRSELERER